MEKRVALRLRGSIKRYEGCGVFFFFSISSLLSLRLRYDIQDRVWFDAFSYAACGVFSESAVFDFLRDCVFGMGVFAMARSASGYS